MKVGICVKSKQIYCPGPQTYVCDGVGLKHWQLKMMLDSMCAALGIS